MQREVLAQQFGPDTRILDLVGRDASPLVGGDVAHAIAAGLHAVQPRVGEIRHGVRQLGELDPVELNVLPRGEMAIATVIAARHIGELAHLIGGERAIRDGDPQHVGMQLQIDAVHQPQRLELILIELAREPARDLTAELSDALRQQGPVEVVVEVHA